jgi:hypothetical protein
MDVAGGFVRGIMWGMAKKKITVIQFPAQVWSVRTTVDGGVNVTFAMSDKQIEQVAQLLECKKNNAVLEIAAVPIKPEAKKIPAHDRPAKRTQRYPYKD